ncbi:acyltransferase [Nereida sp. MMG025]|uniref:acyltransferase family protein n=1 Tax=Nereida sp. MMG025 TaxID=2909981 RepID=UPI001F185AFA|nr:acyltransferase [Nereida sp. MMG025]MCF6444759.1 acyltransferase [Nereida sp. MMG025]
MTYVPQYDGLRAFAVALVMAYHMPFFDGMPGGYIGVDVFFVLSGYLTCRLALAQDRLDVMGYMSRRFVRVAPALYAMMAIVMAASFALFGLDLWQAALPTFFFQSNWWNMMGAELHVFSHAWSLAIELKFYAVIAILVVLLGQRVRHLLLTIFLLQTCARWGAEFADWHPNYVYSRFWLHSTGLFLGAWLATFDLTPIKISSRAVPLSLIGLIGLAVLGVKSGGQIFSGYILAAELFAALLLIGLPKCMWMGHPVLRSLGRLSYGIYLWHLPVIFFTFAAIKSPWGIAVVVPVTILIAALSYRFIEQPALRLKLSRRPVVA